MTTRASLDQAVSAVTAGLEADASHFPRKLPADHYARLTGWSCQLYGSHRSLTFAGARLARPSPLQLQLECNRCHAEALLIRERLGDLVLDNVERESLTQRALGILSTLAADRFAEIHSCPELRPRQIAGSARALADAAETIAAEFGHWTALAYTLLVAAGLRARPQFDTYGRKLDKLFDRVASAPAVVQAVNGLYSGGHSAGFEARLRLLAAVRDQLWSLKPGRVAPDNFLLTKVLDSMLGLRPSVGNALGLALLDSIVIGRLGMDVRYLTDSGIVRLEAVIDGRSVYWESTEPVPLSFVPSGPAVRIEISDIIGLTYASIGTGHFTRGLWDKAIEEYRHVLEVKPDTPEILASIGASYLRMAQPGDAIKAFEAALRVSPNAAELHHSLGNAYAMQNNWPRAIAAYKKALRIRPNYAEALYNTGLAFQSAGESVQAVAAFQAALAARPDYSTAHLALGNLYLDSREPGKAVEHYREACRIEPQNASCHYNLGRALYEKGQLDQAIRSYLKALDLNPKHAGAWHNLGIAYRDKGQKEKAVEALERAVTLNPNLMR